MNRETLHSASFHTRDASHYLSMAYAGTWGNGPVWALDVALDSLKQAADALGYDLVKRESVKVEEAA